MIKVEHVEKNFGKLHALNDVSLEVNKGEIVSLIGPSGSGKSTLLRCIHGLEKADAGKIYINGEVMDPSDEKKYRQQRNQMGFVFQHFNLFPNMTVLENCNLAQIQVGGKTKEEAEKTSMEYLKRVGLAEKRDAYPNNLSGGQKQRVAIARAMANDPAIILADEPTGALDSVTGRKVMDLFHKLHDEEGKTIVLITHSPELAEETERIVTIKDGHVMGERKGSGR